MQDKDLQKLRRADLLELLVELSRENDSLKKQLAAANAEIENREILLRDAGSIAEASLRINGVFEAVQKAADQYLDNVRRMTTGEPVARAQQRKPAAEMSGTAPVSARQPSPEQRPLRRVRKPAAGEPVASSAKAGQDITKRASTDVPAAARRRTQPLEGFAAQPPRDEVRRTRVATAPAARTRPGQAEKIPVQQASRTSALRTERIASGQPDARSVQPVPARAVSGQPMARRRQVSAQGNAYASVQPARTRTVSSQASAGTKPVVRSTEHVKQ